MLFSTAKYFLPSFISKWSHVYGKFVKRKEELNKQQASFMIKRNEWNFFTCLRVIFEIPFSPYVKRIEVNRRHVCMLFKLKKSLIRCRMKTFWSFNKCECYVVNVVGWIVFDVICLSWIMSSFLWQCDDIESGRFVSKCHKVGSHPLSNSDGLWDEKFSAL